MRTTPWLLFVLLAWTTACESPTTPNQLSAAGAMTPSLIPDDQVFQIAETQEVLGVTGEGALYAMYVPPSWNGALVLYAHGIVPDSDPLTLDHVNLPEVRTALNAMGYAVAYSSWSENGWAVIDGIQRTHQLVGLFTARFQKPERVYIIGRSLGSLVAVALAETYPAQYDGVLAVCGFLGGAQAFLDAGANLRLLFDLYYPGALPGDPMSPPIDGAVAVALALPALAADPTGAAKIAAALQAIGTPLDVVPGVPASLVGTIVTGLSVVTDGVHTITARTYGQFPFDNWDLDYVIPEVQTGIARYQGHPASMNYMQRAYQPTGHLQIPMVALDITWDVLAPTFHKDRYEALLTAAGAAALFARITVPEFGHCPAAADPVVAAFQQLAAWVETGVRP